MVKYKALWMGGGKYINAFIVGVFLVLFFSYEALGYFPYTLKNRSKSSLEMYASEAVYKDTGGKGGLGSVGFQLESDKAQAIFWIDDEFDTPIKVGESYDIIVGDGSVLTSQKKVWQVSARSGQVILPAGYIADVTKFNFFYYVIWAAVSLTGCLVAAYLLRRSRKKMQSA